MGLSNVFDNKVCLLNILGCHASSNVFESPGVCCSFRISVRVPRVFALDFGFPCVRHVCFVHQVCLL